MKITQAFDSHYSDISSQLDKRTYWYSDPTKDAEIKAAADPSAYFLWEVWQKVTNEQKDHNTFRDVPFFETKRDSKGRATSEGALLGAGLMFSTGGISGGSYHEDSSPEAYTEAVNFIALQNILDDFFINAFEDLSFSQAVRLRKLFRNEEFTKYEYYGNSTSYKVIVICFEELIAHAQSYGIKLAKG